MDRKTAHAARSQTLVQGYRKQTVGGLGLPVPRATEGMWLDTPRALSESVSMVVMHCRKQ